MLLCLPPHRWRNIKINSPDPKNIFLYRQKVDVPVSRKNTPDSSISNRSIYAAKVKTEKRHYVILMRCPDHEKGRLLRHAIACAQNGVLHNMSLPRHASILGHIFVIGVYKELCIECPQIERISFEKCLRKPQNISNILFRKCWVSEGVD